MKKKLIIGIGIFLTLVMCSMSASAETVVDMFDEPLDYLETMWSNGLLGNVSLIFNHSDTGTEDIALLNNFFVSGPNETYYKAQSNPIVVDYNFTNDTKSYFYLDLNNLGAEILYRVQVNYSSIEVPRPPWWYWIEELEEKNQTIANLTENITRLQLLVDALEANVNLLNGTILTLQSNLLALQTTHNEYVANTSQKLIDYWVLVNVSEGYEMENILLKSDKRTLIKQMDAKNKTMSDVTSMWSTGYTNDKGERVFYFNLAWALIGGLISLILFVIFYSKISVIVQKVFGGRTLPVSEKKEWQMKKEELSSVENDVLNPKADEPIEFVAVPENSEKTPSKEIKTEIKEEKVRYWDTPAGLARRQEMREWATKKNEERKKLKDGT